MVLTAIDLNKQRIRSVNRGRFSMTRLSSLLARLTVFIRKKRTQDRQRKKKKKLKNYSVKSFRKPISAVVVRCRSTFSAAALALGRWDDEERSRS